MRPVRLLRILSNVILNGTRVATNTCRAGRAQFNRDIPLGWIYGGGDRPLRRVLKGRAGQGRELESLPNLT